jgi:hypothetical protein
MVANSKDRTITWEWLAITLVGVVILLLGSGGGLVMRAQIGALDQIQSSLERLEVRIDQNEDTVVSALLRLNTIESNRYTATEANATYSLISTEISELRSAVAVLTTEFRAFAKER